MNRAQGSDFSDDRYSISELSGEFDVTPRTLRWYESEGLLSPIREGTRRIYNGRDRTRVRLILRGKRIGLTLAEIRDIIEMYDAAPGEGGQLRHLIDRIGDRRTELQQRRDDIERTLRELDEVEARALLRLSELTPDRGF